MYLGSLLLRQAGLQRTPYNDFLLKLMEELPVIHMLGGYDREDNYYSWEQLKKKDNPYYELIMNYSYLVYNHLFDSKGYQAPMFELGK